MALYDTAELESIRGATPVRHGLPRRGRGLIALATMPEADMVLISIVGTAGLAPGARGDPRGQGHRRREQGNPRHGREEVTREAAKHKVAILPVDSEHNAIFQCLVGEPSRHIRRLILTASGGPFRKTPASELGKVTPEQALKHPTWNMGRKITIDSATLFNKGLEMIEARWLFGVPMAQVDVVVHPQSIVHSLVESSTARSLHSSATPTCASDPVRRDVSRPARKPAQAA